MKTKKFRTSEQTTVWIIGANKKIQLPSGAVVEIAEEQDTIARIQEPPEYSGVLVRVVPELARVLVSADNDKLRSDYRASIDRCLALIVDGFDTLPIVSNGTSSMHVMRDLGLVTSWVAEPKLVRPWLHHVNLEIPHPSLSVEQATFPGNEQHFVLYLTQSW